MKIFLNKMGHFFIFKQTRVFRITCFLLFKSALVVNCLIAKPERVALSKLCKLQSLVSQKESNLYNSKSEPIPLEDNFRHLKYFLQFGAKVAVKVSFQIRFLKT